MGTIQIDGSTPKITVGNATAEDATILFDGNAQDFYIALDDSADDLLIGLGSTVGTTPAISIDENLAVKTYGDITMTGTTPVLTIGDAGAEDTAIVFDGNAQDFYIALDDSADDLLIGLGSTVGTTPAISIDENLAVKTYGDITMTGTTPTLTIGDAGAEDTAIVFDGNAQDWHIGLDDSADDLVIGLGSTLGTTTHMAFDEAGTVTKPLQPAFCVTEDGGGQSITNATETTITLDIEIFDTNADFASNTFTAPVTGKYLMTGQVIVDAGSTPNSRFNSLMLQFVASNRTWQFRSPQTYTNEDDVMTIKGTAVVDMDASDTCSMNFFASRNGASGATTVYNNGTVPNTFFSGYLLG